MPQFPPSLPPSPPLKVNPPPTDFRDPASHSYPGHHFTDHIHLDLHLDHTTHLIEVVATYSIRVLQKEVPHLLLDVCGLDIQSITTGESNQSLKYSVEKAQSPIGAALRITLPEHVRSQPLLNLKIQYSTPGNGNGHPAGGALDWLSTEQTSSNAPFVFTQCQAIHARSIFPCQDTPAVKATYSALVSVAEPYQDLTVVMSAQRVPLKQGDREGASRFECAVPVPSYLVALACGRLEFRELSHRCCVWAEPAVVESAKWEFEEVESMLATAEKIAGPYLWGRYDLLVLPGSFPYGGMENPFLTFVTPTLLAGDRSLVSVVVHEIAHRYGYQAHLQPASYQASAAFLVSDTLRLFLRLIHLMNSHFIGFDNLSWSGNLVSCQDCRHFWVNEGFTVKLERRILRELYGSGREGLDAIAGRRTLDDFIDGVGEDHKYTSLVAKLQPEEDPDDYFSCVAYEKGYNLLLWLEHCVERDGGNFHEFLRKYFHVNRYQSISTTDFVTLFTEEFPKVAGEIDFDKWLYGVGPCPSLAPIDRSLVAEASALAQKWLEALKKVHHLGYDEALKELRTVCGSEVTGFEEWDSKQKLCFLTELRPIIEISLTNGEGAVWNTNSAAYLQELYKLSEIRNSEIRFTWCRLALRAGFEKILDNVKDFVSTQGRMKFIRPLYHDLHNVYPKGAYAKNLFVKNKNSYHSIATKMIERDLSTQ